MKSAKKLFLALLVLTLALALAACGKTEEKAPETPPEADKPAAEATETASDFEYVKGNGKIVVGYTEAPPMNYTDEKTGEFVGFDTELTKLVCEKLGVEPEFTLINWETKEVALAGKQIDCVWNGMTITPERQEAMEITKPYVKNAQALVMKADADYKDTASLIGKSVAFEMGSAGAEVVAEDANLKQSEPVEKSVQTDCLMEVKAGTADAAVIDLTQANVMIGEGTNYTDLKVMDRLAEEDYGIAFRKGSDICQKVNDILASLKADGSMQKLAEKYGLELA